MAETAAGTPNGLASLTQKRARRTMPPTRHPQKTATSPGGGGAEPTAPAGTTITAPAVVTDERPAVRPTVPAAAPAGPINPGPADPVMPDAVTPDVVTADPVPAAPLGQARPATVYLDDAQVAFLEQARVAGLLGSPRLDLSKSAVVRLALRRLAEQLSVDEIREVLRSQPVDPTRTGRKKR